MAHKIKLDAAVEKAESELPEGWTVKICVERNSGWVVLEDEDGKSHHFPSNHEYLSETVEDAVEYAVAKSQETK